MRFGTSDMDIVNKIDDSNEAFYKENIDKLEDLIVSETLNNCFIISEHVTEDKEFIDKIKSFNNFFRSLILINMEYIKKGLTNESGHIGQLVSTLEVGQIRSDLIDFVAVITEYCKANRDTIGYNKLKRANFKKVPSYEDEDTTFKNALNKIELDIASGKYRLEKRMKPVKGGYEVSFKSKSKSRSVACPEFKCTLSLLQLKSLSKHLDRIEYRKYKESLK